MPRPRVCEEMARICQVRVGSSWYSMDAERLTVESTISHLELLEIRECAPFRRDSASELVRVAIRAADVEHLE